MGGPDSLRPASLTVEVATQRWQTHTHNMGGKNFTTEEKRSAIELRKAGVPLKAIRDQLSMSKNSLRRILAHAASHPSLPVSKRKIGTGRKSTVSQATLTAMRKHLNRDPTLSARQLKALMPALQHLATRSIQHICQKTLALPSRKMAKKPVLTEQMKEKRMTFCHQYGHWTVDDWKMVMFSDESHFELNTFRRGLCRRPVGSDRFDVRFTRKTVKHPAKVMAWACFSWKGRGALEFLDQGEMMNGVRYRRILEEKLELFMHQHQTSHFLQDGAPCHRSKVVSEWFRERPNITLIDWPGNSPDLNPIENCWAWMKAQLENCKATSIPLLKVEILRLWTLKMDDSQYLRNLVESMPRRLQAVLESSGNATKY